MAQSYFRIFLCDWCEGRDWEQRSGETAATAAAMLVTDSQWRRAAENETASQSNQLHDGPVVRAGTTLWRDSLSGRLYEGRAKSETWTHWGSHSGTSRRRRRHHYLSPVQNYTFVDAAITYTLHVTYAGLPQSTIR